MKRLFILISCVVMLLSGCGQQSNPTQSSVVSTEDDKSLVQTDISVSDLDETKTQQVLVKRTMYVADEIFGWFEYKYNAENQREYYNYTYNSYTNDGELSYRGVEKYDDDWNLIEELKYNSYDVLISEDRYDENGNHIYSAEYSENGVLKGQSNWTYVYNENGTLLRREQENSDGTKYNDRLYTCDENNRIVMVSVYSSDGTLIYTIYNEYDEYGNIIEEKYEYDLTGDIFSIISYTYDEFGNELNTQSISPTSPENNFSITSTYDDNGFLLQENYEEAERAWYWLYEYDMIPVSSK